VTWPRVSRYVSQNITEYHCQGLTLSLSLRLRASVLSQTLLPELRNIDFDTFHLETLKDATVRNDCVKIREWELVPYPTFFWSSLVVSATMPGIIFIVIYMYYTVSA
jgi:hypothetical protein